MFWIQWLQPDLVLDGSVFRLTPDLIEKHNLQGLVLDVDETLVPFSQAQATAELQQWIEQLKPLVSLWLVSNNMNSYRIRRIAEVLEVPYITGAGKPSRRKLRKATEAMNLPTERIAMVGDRLFTDVLAGNRLGMFTVLVEPMMNPAQEIRKHPLRTFEVWISQLLGVSLKTP
ncbi:MAG: YqeG family HAD IIIA-type phosphatase [Leptolyngbya sp. SIO4C5]|uniref:YqeG family HAD IIIA-type phosphatase n=1 Tax=Sphaerothrix gracilis TaxID=3151835 RepID=UPI0013C0BACC|nr:YqeG family HAD IIIA-type phosphatase [Leptolyngbya sp. SIO4C5]